MAHNYIRFFWIFIKIRLYQMTYIDSCFQIESRIMYSGTKLEFMKRKSDVVGYVSKTIGQTIYCPTFNYWHFDLIWNAIQNLHFSSLYNVPVITFTDRLQFPCNHLSILWPTRALFKGSRMEDKLRLLLGWDTWKL